MSEPALAFRGEEAPNEIVVNFGLFSGREATRAEIERLGQSLLSDFEAVDIVCEQRYTFDRRMEGSVYLVKVIPTGSVVDGSLLEKVEAWARECIAERGLLTP